MTDEEMPVSLLSKTHSMLPLVNLYPIAFSGTGMPLTSVVLSVGVLVSGVKSNSLFEDLEDLEDLSVEQFPPGQLKDGNLNRCRRANPGVEFNKKTKIAKR